MRRREFCKLLIGAAATAVTATTSKAAEPLLATGTGTIAPGYNQPDGTYADFCAIPELQRRYYAIKGNSIVTETRDEATWSQTAWIRRYKNPSRPVVPVRGGAHNDVPITTARY